jgi:hypothetical protein
MLTISCRFCCHLSENNGISGQIHMFPGWLVSCRLPKLMIEKYRNSHISLNWKTFRKLHKSIVQSKCCVNFSLKFYAVYWNSRNFFLNIGTMTKTILLLNWNDVIGNPGHTIFIYIPCMHFLEGKQTTCMNLFQYSCATRWVLLPFGKNDPFNLAKIFNVLICVFWRHSIFTRPRYRHL